MEKKRISIHAPRVGCDVHARIACATFPYFNPRTPRGVRRSEINANEKANLFQSTHPAWGATHRRRRFGRYMDISIHAPRVGCDYKKIVKRRKSAYFNPRTPRGVRRRRLRLGRRGFIFQSTHPAWGATGADMDAGAGEGISIHAPRVGCDCLPPRKNINSRNFNPRTPRGVRP